MQNLIFIKIFILSLLFLIVVFREKKIRFYHPAILVAFVYVMEYGIPALYMTISPGEFMEYSRFLYSDILSNGLSFVVLTLLFFLLGFYSPYYNKHLKKLVVYCLKKIPNSNNYVIEIRNLPMIIILLLIFGWIARIFLIKTGAYFHAETGMDIELPQGFALYSQYLSIISLFPIVAICLLFSEWIKKVKDYKYLLFTVMLIILEVLYALPSGSKERVIFPLFLLIAIYSLKKKIPVLTILITSAFALLFVFPFNEIYRNITRTGDVISDCQYAFNIYLRTFTRFDSYSLDHLFFGIFGERLNFAVVVGSIVENTPRIWDFKMGYTYFLFFISLVPRIIWPSKPGIASFANDFGRDYGFISPSDYTTSIAMSWIGEMFINFGWLGILVAFCYGLLYQTIYSYFLRSERISTLSIYLYSFSLYYMVRGDMFAEQFSGLLKIFTVVIFLFYPFLKKLKA